MSSFKGAHDFTISHSTFNDFAGDATIINSPLVNLFIQHLTGSPLPPGFCEKLGKHVLSQNLSKLPCASAAYNDYTTQDKRRVACFRGTRKALLREIAEWIPAVAGPRLYLLWGIAGVGKSTVAQTVAEKTDNLHRLGASFFFSRSEIERKNARMFFTTIAFHLCVFSEDFAGAIEKVLLTQRGRAAISKEPLEQLNVLILEPLRNLNHRDLIPIVIVIDALDECDDQDGPTIFIGLARLVRELPFFKVILTCRPRSHLQPLVDNPDKTEFHLQNIEDRIVDNDIRLYLEYSLSPEQVRERLPGLRSQWCASNQEIESLVGAAGQLFIIASTTVLFILDKVACNPASRMKTLQVQFAHNRTSFNALNEFYTVILRSAVPEGCECDIVEQYQLVVGTIVLVQDPLSVEALAVLIGLPEESIYAVLGNLQSVISLSGKNIPHVYHKSFPDYLTDNTRCKDGNLHIVPRAHHTRISLCCLRLMNGRLKQNIFGVNTDQRSMHNDVILQEENITTELLMKKIPGDLRYACIYWADHVKDADTENVNLTKEVKTFIMEHLLHWLEALSWINKIGIAYPAVRVLSKYMKPTFDTSRIISDALRFIARFSDQIRRSALYTHYCALPFTPTDCPLYRIYSKEMLCRLEGMPTEWDALISSRRGLPIILDPVFSHDNSKFWLMDRRTGMALLDAESGMYIRSYKGDRMALAHDFSVAAVSNGCAVTLWSVADNGPVATITPEKDVSILALSFDGARLAAMSVDKTVGLWDSRNVKLIASLEGHVRVGRYGFYESPLSFAARGYRLAIISDDGSIQLWDGEDGGLVARLDYESEKHDKFVFSQDGRRLAALTEDRSLTLWDAEKGIFIGAVRNVGNQLAISEDGSFIATGGREHPVRLWSGNPLLLVNTLDVEAEAHHLAMSCDILAVASYDIKLYDVNNGTVVAALHSGEFITCLALSPDCTRLVVEYEDEIKLFDVTLLKASTLVPRQQHKGRVTALAFSPDSSQLASGLDDGTIELWDANHTEGPTAGHKLHSERITTLTFSLDGKLFISGSEDRTVEIWSSDGTPMERKYIFGEVITSAAFSRDLLAVATNSTITLFPYETLFPVDVLDHGADSLTFSGGGTLLAWTLSIYVTVWNVSEHAPIATFTAKACINRLTFSPGGSQLAVKSMCKYEGYELFDIVNKHAIELMGHEHPSWIPGVMNGLLISLDNQSLIGQYSQNHDRIAVLWIHEDDHVWEIEFGASIIALGCRNGRVLFVRFPATTSSTN